MSMSDPFPSTPVVLRARDPLLDEAQFAAVAFLARYSGRTLESYRADLRQFLQWIGSVGLVPLQATRAHIELYRGWMDERSLDPATVDRRLSTVCGYYRFAHIDGRIPSNPAQYVRRPASTRPPSRAWTAASWRRSSTRPSGRRRCTLRWPCCSA